MNKGLPNKYERGSFYVQFHSYLEGPCHTTQHWISPTVSAVKMHMSRVPYICILFRQCSLNVMWFLPLGGTTRKKELHNSKTAERLFSTY